MSAAPEGLAFLRLARTSPQDAARLLLGRVVGTPEDGVARAGQPDPIAADVLRAAAALHALRRRSLESLAVERLLRAFVTQVLAWARENGRAETLSTAVSLFGRVEAYERSHGPVGEAVRTNPDLAAAWSGVERLGLDARRVVRKGCGMLVDVTAANFEEHAYLDSNADIRGAVANGTFRTGREHFSTFGFGEGRQILVFSDS